MPRCVECNVTRALWDRHRDIHLCKICRETVKYKLMYKTHIKDQYNICMDDYEDYEPIIYDRGSWGLRYLYKLSDVHHIFCIHHNIDHNDIDAIETKRQEIIREKAQNKADRKERRAHNQIVNRQKRHDKLVVALAGFGLILRADSKLCNGYINGTIKDQTIKQIVRRMCEMKFLYEYANMSQCYQEICDAEEDDFEFVRDKFSRGTEYYPGPRVVVYAEELALKRIGGYPEVWPWLSNQ
jgi:hypothetical protein